MTTRKLKFSEIKKTMLLLRYFYRHVALSESSFSPHPRRMNCVVRDVLSMLTLDEWLHFTRIPAFVSLLREPSGAVKLRATRTFFDDNTRHNRARRTSAHTNGMARRLPWSEDSRCCSSIPYVPLSTSLCTTRKTYLRHRRCHLRTIQALFAKAHRNSRSTNDIPS